MNELIDCVPTAQELAILATVLIVGLVVVFKRKKKEEPKLPKKGAVKRLRKLSKKDRK